MTKNDGIKLGSAVVLTGVAVTLLLLRGRTNGDDADRDENRSYWYCTKVQKSFVLSGREYDEKVRMTRPQRQGRMDPAELRRPADDLVTRALSPYSNDWTGVPAEKCQNCGEVFPLSVEEKKSSACPKCKWSPSGTPAP